MNVIRTRLHVGPDGAVTGHVPETVPQGEHEAEIVVQLIAVRPDEATARAIIRAVQDRLARLPVLDPRPTDEILGYDENGLFR